MTDSEQSNVRTLLSGMIRFHGQALERLKPGPLDTDQTRAELATLHQAAGTLASLLIDDDSALNHGHERRLELTKIRAAHLYEESRGPIAPLFSSPLWASEAFW